MNKDLRTKMIKAMDLIMSSNDATYEIWKSLGVKRGDIIYGDLSDNPIASYYTDSDNFGYLMWLFINLMYKVPEDGLTCDGVTSKLAFFDKEK